MAIKEPKSELCSKIVEKMAEKHGVSVTKKLVTQIFQSAEELLTKDYVAAAIENNDDIHIHAFSSVMRIELIAAHKSRDPRTGDPVEVPPRWALRLATPPRNVSDLVVE